MPILHSGPTEVSSCVELVGTKKVSMQLAFLSDRIEDRCPEELFGAQKTLGQQKII